MALAFVAIVGTRSYAAPEARRIAAVLFKRGKTLYQKGAYEKALASFREGFERYPLRGFLVNIGQCYRKLHRYEEAASAFHQFLDGQTVPPAMRREVEDALAAVEEQRPPPKGAEPKGVEAKQDPPPEPMAPPVESTPEVAAPTPVRSDLFVAVPAPPPKKRRWVGAVIGVTTVLVAGGIAAGIYFGVRSAAPGAGSLGLIDARTH